MIKTRIGAVPKFNENLKTYLEFSETLVNFGVDGVFTTSCNGGGEIFNGIETSFEVILGGLRGKFPELTIGPLSIMTSHLNNESFTSLSNTLGGSIIICAQIGSNESLDDVKVKELPFTKNKQEKEKCELYYESSSLELVKHLPNNVKVYLHNNLETTIKKRKLVLRVYNETNLALVQYAIQNRFEWVFITQTQDETNTEYATRIRKALYYSQANTSLW